MANPQVTTYSHGHVQVRVPELCRQRNPGVTGTVVRAPLSIPAPLHLSGCLSTVRQLELVYHCSFSVQVLSSDVERNVRVLDVSRGGADVFLALLANCSNNCYVDLTCRVPLAGAHKLGVSQFREHFAFPHTLAVVTGRANLSAAL